MSPALMRTCAIATVVLIGGAAPSLQSVRQVATLTTARSVHTASALPSGRVLFAGGMTEDGGSLASLELYDPNDNTVEEVGFLRERRAGHTATLLDDGRVLIAGGYNGEYLTSVEIFDPATKRMSLAGVLVEGRSGQTATLLPDGRVLFVGGVGRGWIFLRSAEVFDPRTGRSALVGSMSVPRESHTATLLQSGHVLIAGGHVGRRQHMEVHATVEVFDPQSRRFERVGTLGTARHKHDALRLADGRVLVIAGADRTDRLHYTTTEIYDPRTQRFQPGPTMSHRRYKIAGTSVLLPNGDVLVTSGARRAELLAVRRMQFQEVSGAYPAAFRFAASAALRGGDVIIAGGYSDRNRSTAGVWRFER